MRTIWTLPVITVGVIITAYATQLDRPPGVFGAVVGVLVLLAHSAGYYAGVQDTRDATRHH